MSYICEKVSKEEFLTLSYRVLRDKTGVEIRHWSNWFNNKAHPKFDTLERAAKDLGMSVTEFVEAFLERRSHTIAAKKSA